MSADIDALYKNASAVLWVEDPETRAWLNAVWEGLAPNILVLVAGGRSNVIAVCEQAKDAGYRHIFGLIDQDFGTSNRQRWASLDSNERVYRLDVHEIENLLLDSAALAGCDLNTGKRTASDIDSRLVETAGARLCWVACTRFLADTRRDATNGFPPDPRTIASLADAEAYVNDSAWFSKTADGCPALATTAAVSAALQAAHDVATAALTDGSWKTTFPGKQLFGEIRGYVHQNARGVGARIDLVKAVGAWQRTNRLPPQVSELRDAIRARI